MVTKKWWTSKSLWLGVFVTLGGIAEYIAGLPPGVSAATMLAGVLAVIVRFLTNQPVGK